MGFSYFSGKCAGANRPQRSATSSKDVFVGEKLRRGKALDHYPYRALDSNGNPTGKRINCRSGATIGADGTCGTNVHPWPTANDLHWGTLSTNYGKRHSTKNCDPPSCGALMFGNYFDSAAQAGLSMIANPGDFLEDIRRQWRAIYALPSTNDDAPVLTSGWRNPERNEAIGGVINSEHQWSAAVDVKPNIRKVDDVPVYITGYFSSDADAAPTSWCKLAKAAWNAGARSQIIVENGRTGMDTYRFQYYWRSNSVLNNTADDNKTWNDNSGENAANIFDSCVDAVRKRIEACIVVQPATLTAAQKGALCSPNHVHTAK